MFVLKCLCVRSSMRACVRACVRSLRVRACSARLRTGGCSFSCSACTGPLRMLAALFPHRSSKASLPACLPACLPSPPSLPSLPPPISHHPRLGFECSIMMISQLSATMLVALKRQRLPVQPQLQPPAGPDSELPLLVSNRSKSSYVVVVGGLNPTRAPSSGPRGFARRPCRPSL